MPRHVTVDAGRIHPTDVQEAGRARCEPGYRSPVRQVARRVTALPVLRLRELRWEQRIDDGLAKHGRRLLGCRVHIDNQTRFLKAHRDSGMNTAANPAAQSSVLMVGASTGCGPPST